MEIIDAIMSRRSIRQYSDEPVSEETVEQLLRAAMAAPSAGNAQPWKFLVVRNPDLLAGIPEIHPHAKMAPQAQLAIVVCSDPSLEKYPGFWVQDVSAATQNLLLAAHGVGLGAVWCGLYPNQGRMADFRDRFDIPEEIVPFALIPMSYPAEEKGRAERYDAGRVSLDRYVK